MSLKDLGLLFKHLWPFIAEIFFAGKSLKDVLINNKFSVFLSILLCLSITVNYYMFKRVYDLAFIARQQDSPIGKGRKNTNQTVESKAQPEEPKKTYSDPVPRVDPKPLPNPSHLDEDPDDKDNPELIRKRLEQIYGY